MTVFISTFVRIHDLLLFQNKHICLAIYGAQCESPMSHLQVRMNEAEMLYFSFKAARSSKRYQLGTSWKCFRVYAGLQNKMHIFREYFLSFTVSKITSKVELTKTLGYWQNLIQLISVDLTIIVLT